MFLSEWFCGLRCSLLLRGTLQVSRPFPVNGKRALVFAPHQDDETFGCGGLIALKRGQGTQVAVIFLTDGSHSHGDNPDISVSELPHIRRREAVAALHILGVPETDITFLSQPDAGLHALPVAEQEELIECLTILLQKFHPEEVYVPHRHDRHPDHEETFTLVRRSLARTGLTPDLWQYPIWLFWWRNWPFFQVNAQDMAYAYHLPLGSAHERKKLAIATYESQMPILPLGFSKRFLCSPEIFFKTAAALSPEEGKANAGGRDADQD